jgi:transketolase
MSMATTTALGYEDLPGLLTLLTGDEKHDRSSSRHSACSGSATGCCASTDRPDDPSRVVSCLEGHGPAAFYAVLAAKGFIPIESLSGFGDVDSRLGYHPDRMLVPGVEISSGSLGHGLPIAVGVALALDAAGPSEPRVICLVGDAELEEGSNFEAIQLAGRLGIGRLTAVVVDNGSSTLGWPGGIEGRFELEGWDSVRVDGRDHEALERAFASPGGDRPLVVVAEVRG